MAERACREQGEAHDEGGDKGGRDRSDPGEEWAVDIEIAAEHDAEPAPRLVKKNRHAEQDLEPVTLKRRLFVYSLIGAPILASAIGIYFLVTWRGGHTEAVKMEEAIVEFDKGREELSPTQAPIFASILQLASGEYVLYPQKMDKDKALALSLQHFTRARSELQRATGPERFAVAGELARAQLGLGGTDEQVKDGSRFRWVPDAPSNRPLRVQVQRRSQVRLRRILS